MDRLLHGPRGKKSSLDAREICHLVHCSAKTRKQVEPMGALVIFIRVYRHFLEEAVEGDWQS